MFYPGLFGLILLLLHRPNSKLNQKQQEMAAQALVSSSLTSSVETARQILGSRPLQSPSRKSSSFVVRAASTPPVKVTDYLTNWLTTLKSRIPIYSTNSLNSGLGCVGGAHFQQGADRPLWFASKQSLTYLDGRYTFFHITDGIQNKTTFTDWVVFHVTVFQVTMGSIHWDFQTLKAQEGSSSQDG